VLGGTLGKNPPAIRPPDAGTDLTALDVAGEVGVNLGVGAEGLVIEGDPTVGIG
jgi:hypothetical protein